MLLLDYICSQRVKHGMMPADPVMIKTIVTMDMGGGHKLLLIMESGLLMY